MKHFGRYLFVYAAMIMLFSAMQWIAYAIPHELTDSNVRESMQLLSKEGKFPRLCNNILWAKDNCTDGSMYNIAVSSYGMSPLEGMLFNPRTGVDFSTILTSDYGLYAMEHPDDGVPRLSYGRYWHGYMFPLKISSIFVSLKWLRVINILAMSLLLIISGMMIWRRYGKLIGLGWILTFIIVGFEVVPLSLQYVGCYYIMYISVLLMMRYPKLMANGIFYFVIGGCTSYIDFLTVPVLTLGMPLLICVIEYNGKIKYRQIIRQIFDWGLGYAMIWSSKWLLVSLYAGNDFAPSFFFNGGHTLLSIAGDGFEHKYFMITCILLGVCLIADVACYLFMRHRCVTPIISRLFFVSLLPFGWYAVMFMHSVVHIWFVYRALTVTVFACTVMAFNNACLNKSRNETVKLQKSRNESTF